MLRLSVEFGLCKENGDLKAYGSGLLSLLGEIEYACQSYLNGEENFVSGKEQKILDWDPHVASVTEFPITTYQPVYLFTDDSLHSGKKAMGQFCEQLPRPFFSQCNSHSLLGKQRLCILTDL